MRNLNLRRKPLDVYYDRLLGMMVDYGISLGEAIRWDFDGFMPMTFDILLKAEEEYKYYLHVNCIDDNDHSFFTRIALGIDPDIGLRKDNKDGKKEAFKEDGSNTEGA